MQGYSKFKFNYGKVSINCKRYKKIRGKLTVTICVKYFSEYVLISWHDALCRASREFGSLSLDVNAQCVSQPLLNSSYKVTGVPTPVSVSRILEKAGVAMLKRTVFVFGWRVESSRVHVLRRGWSCA